MSAPRLAGQQKLVDEAEPRASTAIRSSGGGGGSKLGADARSSPATRTQGAWLRAQKAERGGARGKAKRPARRISSRRWRPTARRGARREMCGRNRTALQAPLPWPRSRSCMEALKVAQGGDGGELALGGGGVSATATPAAAGCVVGRAGAARRGGAEIMSSARKYGTSGDPPPAPAADAAGEVRAGLLSKKPEVARPIFEQVLGWGATPRKRAGLPHRRARRSRLSRTRCRWPARTCAARTTACSSPRPRRRSSGQRQFQGSG